MVHAVCRRIRCGSDEVCHGHPVRPLLTAMTAATGFLKRIPLLKNKIVPCDLIK